jgi:hypothetical protein
MLLGDSEKDVEDFIMREAPTTPRYASQNPRAKSGAQETVYTRLRNEIGHVRTGGDLDKTKNEIRRWVGELAALTKRAIESHP